MSGLSGTNSEVQFRNSYYNCSLNVNFNRKSYSLKWKEATERLNINGELAYETIIKGESCLSQENTFNLTTNVTKRNTWLLYKEIGGKLEKLKLPDTKVERVVEGKFTLRFINVAGRKVIVNFNSRKNSDEQNKYEINHKSSADYKEYPFGEYSIILDDKTMATNMEFRSGLVSTMVIGSKSKDNYFIDRADDIGPHKISILYMIPQYFLLSFAECLFSISGIAFAYAQAPPSMSAMIQASWFWTNAFGNLLVVILSKAVNFSNPAWQFFLYAGLMCIAIIIFTILGIGYKYKTEEDMEFVVKEGQNKDNDQSKEDGYENKAATLDDIDMLHTL